MDIQTLSGEVKGQAELPDSFVGSIGTRGLLWEAVRAYLANQRQGTAKAKTRAEVSGTGKKPYRQKHTGRARHGSRRSPIFVGGGVNFGPHPRDYSLKMPRKKRRQALRTALAVQHAEGRVGVVEDFELSSPKTKEMVGVLQSLKVEGSVLLLPEKVSDNARLAGRNIPGLTIMSAAQVHTYAVLNHDRILFTESGLNSIIGLGEEQQ